jgi:hypothetical protein
VLDGADIRLSDTASKLSCLELLIELYELDAPEAEVILVAGARKRGTSGPGGKRSSKKAGVFAVEKVKGARTCRRKKARLYLVGWKGYGEEDDSWVPFSDLLLPDPENAGGVCVHGKIDAEVGTADGVLDDELVADVNVMSERSAAAEGVRAALNPGDRVVFRTPRTSV